MSDIIKFFKKLFGALPEKSCEELAREALFSANYEDSSGFNLVSIIANKLANVVCSDSSLKISGDSTRASFLDKILKRCAARLRLIVTRTFGIGGLILKPYIYAGDIYVDIITQDRFFVLEQHGEIITKACFIADSFSLDSDFFMRIEVHSLDESGLYTIDNLASRNGIPIPLDSVPAWTKIQHSFSISNVNSMLFAFLRCPVDNKKDPNSIYGVPITFGQDTLINMISDILNEIPDEYRNKRAFIGADELLFSDKNSLPEKGIYKLFRGNGGIDSDSFWEVFSPEIRHTAYFDGLNNLLALLEKAIAVNRGILTDLSSADATATAIKRSNFDTFSLADNMRKNIETALTQFIYACDVIANAFNLTPRGEFKLVFDWSYGLIEDSSQTFKQLLEAQKTGAISVTELREWLIG